jgi:hypothetical protein
VTASVEFILGNACHLDQMTQQAGLQRFVAVDGN